MPVTTASFISQLNVNYPAPLSGTASLAYADWQDIKRSIQAALPNLTSRMSASSGELNYAVGLTANFQTQIDTLSAGRNTMSAAIVTQLTNLSATLDNRIVAVSASINGQIQTLSATFSTRQDALSASIESQLDTLSATLHTNKLSADATATNAILWEGANQYWQSATPAGTEGDIWFEVED